jgi:hypothetical protein
VIANASDEYLICLLPFVNGALARLVGERISMLSVGADMCAHRVAGKGVAKELFHVDDRLSKLFFYVRDLVATSHAHVVRAWLTVARRKRTSRYALRRTRSTFESGPTSRDKAALSWSWYEGDEMLLACMQPRAQDEEAWAKLGLGERQKALPREPL